MHRPFEPEIEFGILSVVPCRSMVWIIGSEPGIRCRTRLYAVYIYNIVCEAKLFRSKRLGVEASGVQEHRSKQIFADRLMGLRTAW